jgi:3',5'-cyclic AMP phosphodiesterase CpdA
MRRKYKMRTSYASYLRGNAIRIYWITDVHVKHSVTGQPTAEGAIGSGGLFTRIYYASPEKVSRFVSEVNRQKPQLAICTGDISNGDSMDDYNDFSPAWNSIDPSIRKEIVPGNHDILAASADINLLATTLGYSGNPVVANSPFNQAFSLSNGGTTARIITLDSNIDSVGVHFINSIGQLQADAIAFVQNEMATCTENTVLIFMHHPPHINPDWFVSADAIALQTVVDNAVTSRPELKVYCCFGHEHLCGVKRFSNMGDNFPGIKGAALVEENPGMYTILNILPDGSIVFDTVDVFYAYS